MTHDYRNYCDHYNRLQKFLKLIHPYSAVFIGCQTWYFCWNRAGWFL